MHIFHKWREVMAFDQSYHDRDTLVITRSDLAAIGYECDICGKRGVKMVGGYTHGKFNPKRWQEILDWKNHKQQKADVIPLKVVK